MSGVLFLGALSLSYMLAMFFSNESIKWVAYPTQALGKSCKIVPVMVFNVVVAKKSYSVREYVQVLMITLGIILFNLFKARKRGGEGSAADDDSLVGVVLLLASLCCDGITGSYQRVFMDEYRPSTHKLMAGMNLWSIVILVPPLLLTGQGYQGLAYCAAHPGIVPAILWFSLCSAAGQNFIFYCITGPGPLVCAIVTTTRKFFTILLSVLLHPDNVLSSSQWMAVALVFTGLGGEIHENWSRSQNKHTSAAAAAAAAAGGAGGASSGDKAATTTTAAGTYELVPSSNDVSLHVPGSAVLDGGGDDDDDDQREGRASAGSV